MKNDVSNEEIEKVRQMSEDYLSEVKRINSNNLRVKELSEKLKGDIPDFTKWLFKHEIDDLKLQIREDTEDTGYFRWAVEHLPQKDQSIMKQLYIDGYAWDSIIDENGEFVPNGTIGNVRQRSFRKMAELISRMKSEMMVTSDELGDRDSSDDFFKADNIPNSDEDISPGDISPGDISPGDISPGDISPRDISPGDISPRDISPRDISPGDNFSSDSNSSPE